MNKIHRYELVSVNTDGGSISGISFSGRDLFDNNTKAYIQDIESLRSQTDNISMLIKLITKSPRIKCNLRAPIHGIG